MDVLFHRYFAGRALVPQGNGLILPLLEIGFPDLLDPHSGSVAFVVLVVNDTQIVYLFLNELKEEDKHERSYP